MKRTIMLILSASILLCVCCAAHKPFRAYPHTALVTALDEKTDTVTVTDYSGRTWQFTGCEDYCTGDLVALTMSDNGTRNTVLDDEIMQVRYAGDLENWYKYGGAKKILDSCREVCNNGD